MLTPRQRQYLKAQAHPLKPAVHIGKSGVTRALGDELDIMLDSLELVKIRVNTNAREDLAQAEADLAARVPGLEVVRTLGHTLLVYRASRTHSTRYPLPG
jgi:RNA-binding protein